MEPGAQAALIGLCQLENSGTRYYAFYAVSREVAGMNADVMADLTDRLMDAPDEQVLSMAVALLELRRLLIKWDLLGVAGPANIIALTTA